MIINLLIETIARINETIEKQAETIPCIILLLYMHYKAIFITIFGILLFSFFSKNSYAQLGKLNQLSFEQQYKILNATFYDFVNNHGTEDNSFSKFKEQFAPYFTSNSKNDQKLRLWIKARRFQFVGERKKADLPTALQELDSIYAAAKELEFPVTMLDCQITKAWMYEWFKDYANSFKMYLEAYYTMKDFSSKEKKHPLHRYNTTPILFILLLTIIISLKTTTKP